MRHFGKKLKNKSIRIDHLTQSGQYHTNGKSWTWTWKTQQPNKQQFMHLHPNILHPDVETKEIKNFCWFKEFVMSDFFMMKKLNDKIHKRIPKESEFISQNLLKLYKLLKNAFSLIKTEGSFDVDTTLVYCNILGIYFSMLCCRYCIRGPCAVSRSLISGWNLCVVSQLDLLCWQSNLLSSIISTVLLIPSMYRRAAK